MSRQPRRYQGTTGAGIDTAIFGNARRIALKKAYVSLTGETIDLARLTPFNLVASLVAQKMTS